MGMADADKGKKCQCVGGGADKFADATGCLHAVYPWREECCRRFDGGAEDLRDDDDSSAITHILGLITLQINLFGSSKDHLELMYKVKDLDFHKSIACCVILAL